MKKLILIAIFSSALFSCKSLQKSSTAKTMDIYGPGIMHLPVIADLNVRESKVSGTKLGSTSNSLELLKMEAVAMAIKTASADVLVEPAFQIETSGTRVTVTATGFPANYKNFRQMSLTDTMFVKPLYYQRPTTIDPAPVKKKKRGVGVLAGLGAAAATAGVLSMTGAY